MIWHDDVIKWKHFPRYWPFARGIHRSPVNSPRKDQWKWPPFSKQHFQLHFCQWKCLNFNYNFTEVCSSWSNRQLVSISAGNDLVLNSRQAITWTKNETFQWRIYVSQFNCTYIDASPDLKELLLIRYGKLIHIWMARDTWIYSDYKCINAHHSKQHKRV